MTQRTARLELRVTQEFRDELNAAASQDGLGKRGALTAWVIDACEQKLAATGRRPRGSHSSIGPWTRDKREAWTRRPCVECGHTTAEHASARTVIEGEEYYDTACDICSCRQFRDPSRGKI